MNLDPCQGTRCGIDTVEIRRIEKLLASKTSEELGRLFDERELRDAGTAESRVASLAARFAAKEACCKLFPRETALGIIHPPDFVIERSAYGDPRVYPSPAAQAVLDRNRVALVRVSLTHTDTSASAIAWAQPFRIDVAWFGKFCFHFVPFRRGLMLGNLRRAFGDVASEAEIRRMAQACYAHFVRFFIEMARRPLMSRKKRATWIRVENVDIAIRAHQDGKGILLLTGHFGNWEVATVEGLGQFPQYRGLLHFLRRPLKPGWLDAMITRRFRRAGFGTLAKRGSMDAILDLLAQGAIIVFTMDQHAGQRDGIPVDFFGHPAGTFKSLAILALSTKAPVIPACSWREPDGTHVLRFEDPLPLIECEDAGEAIRQNTRAYNLSLERMLLRHPEQWIWMHRRWKVQPDTARPPAQSPGSAS
jgi:phosphopantetheine--protein transferase-like protein